MTTLQGYTDYLQYKYSSGTVKSYLREVEIFTANIQKSIAQTNADDIIVYLNKLRKKGHTNQTINRVLAAIKSVFNYLLIEEVIDHHPCRRLKVIYRKKNVFPTHAFFSPEELGMLLNREERYEMLKARNKLIISLLIYQGLTAENITLMRVEDFNIAENLLHIRRTQRYRARRFVLSPIQIDFFLDYISERSKFKSINNRLFLNKRGFPMSEDGVCSIIEQQKSLFPDKELSIRKIRQSVISNWLNVYNLPLEDVQIMAGHHFPSSTYRYKLQNLNYLVSMANKYHPVNRML